MPFVAVKTHYVGSWFASFPPRGRTACGVVVFKAGVEGEAGTETSDRIEYTEIWKGVDCARCLRSTERKRLPVQSPRCF